MIRDLSIVGTAALILLAAPRASAGPLSELDGLSVSLSYEICSDSCRRFPSQLRVEGDNILLTGAASRTLRYGSNASSGLTTNVSIAGNVLSMASDTVGGRSLTQVSVSGRSCSLSITGPGVPARNMTCRVLSPSLSGPSIPSKAGKPPKDVVDSRCYRLNVKQTDEVCGNKFQFWHVNTVRSTNKPGCPASFRFTYTKPDGAQGDQTQTSGSSFRTCGGRPSGIAASVR